MSNNSISQKVFVMNDMRNKKIVQHNDLITSVSKMDKVPLKFFELAVACLDTENIPENRTVNVSKELLYSFFGTKDNDKHRRFKEAVLKVHEQAVFSISEMNEKTGKFKYRVISPLETTSWNDYDDYVSFKFTESIMPFLIDLSKNYTQYLLSDIAKLNSKHSIVIYKWLSMNYNQYDYYQYTEKRTKKQLYDYQNPIITLEELRRLTNTENKYQRFDAFETRILKDVKEEINQNTMLNFDYEKIRKGRSVHSIRFFITKKEVAPDYDYKLEQQDEVYLQSKKEREQELAKLVKLALENSYTDLLFKYQFLGINDFRNTERLAYLQKSLYPVYDKMAELYGKKEVERHISHVQEEQEAYSKENIAKYLKKSADGYLIQLRNRKAIEKLDEQEKQRF